MALKKINGIGIYYEIHGNGTPLVMIMGLGANAYWWSDDVLEKLSQYFQVIIFDSRGTGRSEDPDIDFSLKDLARDVGGLLDALNIPKAHILGISMGGMIAQEFVLNHPERVNKLVLCATNCGGPNAIPPSAEVISELMKPREGRSEEDVARDTLPLLLTEDLLRDNEVVERFLDYILKFPTSQKTFQRQLMAIFGFNSYEKLPGIAVPTLILHGAKDVLIPPQNAEILAGRIPGAKLDLFESKAHGLFVQAPEVSEALVEFLKD